MRYPFFLSSLFLCLFVLLIAPSSVFAVNYYVSPTGNDTNSGTTESAPFATFDKAWSVIQPGETMYLLDGVYTQTLQPKYRNGRPENPITVKAKNDGKAIIDGQGVRVPVQIGDCWAGGCPIAPGESSPIGNYFVIEGLVARNGDTVPDPITGATEHNGRVVNIDGNNNVLRRISAYNADTDGNSAVIGVSGSNNLLEDCVAAGTGRKMLFISSGSGGYHTFRRCFVFGTEYLERNWHDHWPWQDGIQVYNNSHNTFENDISYGSIPSWGINIQANSSTAVTENNHILGSIVMNVGMNRNGTVRNFGCPWNNPTQPEPCGLGDRPQPSQYTNVADFDWTLQRSGFSMYGQGLLRDNLFQDNFAYGNAGWGLGTSTTNTSNSNNLVNRITLVNNGLDLSCGTPWPCGYGGRFTDMSQNHIGGFNAITDSKIEKIYMSGDYSNRVLTSTTGSGANLKYRYKDRQMTNEPLWPWPMETRIRIEFADPAMIGENYTIQNLSVTNEITAILAQYGALDEPIITPTQSPLSPTPTPKLGDTNGDGSVNLTDLATLLSNFGKNSQQWINGDFNNDGSVNLSDLSTLLANFGR